MDPTHRLAQQIFDGFNRRDLDVGTVAALLCGSGPLIKVFAFKLASRIILNLALECEYSDFTEGDDLTKVLIMSRQISEIVDLEDAP
jgi:hypothetical protein